MTDPQPLHEVLLIGLGAVGGLYAYVLEKSGRCRVTAIARSAYPSINKHGLTIRSKKFGEIPNWKPHRLLQNAEEAADRHYRLIICTVKCLPDLQPTSTILAPFLVPLHSHTVTESTTSLPTTVVLIQNGIGIEQPLAEAFPSIHIISCVAWIGANLILPPSGPPASPDAQPRTRLLSTIAPCGAIPILEHGLLEKLVFGLYDGEGFAPSFGPSSSDPDPGECGNFVDGLLNEEGQSLQGELRAQKRAEGKLEVDLFASLLRDGGGEVEVLEHIQPARWAKNLWNASISTMCSLSRLPVRALFAPEVLPHTLPVVRRTMLEIIYVARSLGYRETDLPAKSIDDAIQLTIQNYQDKKTVPADSSVNQAPEQPDDNPFEEDEEDEEQPRGLDSPPPPFKPSMLIDLEMGRPMELEPIVGAVLDRARSKAIETPRLDLLYSALKVLQESAARSHATHLNTQAQEKHLHAWAMRKPSVGGSGTSDSRDAWMKEVKRRSKLGGEGPSSTNHQSPLRASISSRTTKVTGQPL